MEIIAEAEKYIVDSNEAVEFKMVRSKSDLEDETKSFAPDMSHQIFGQQEIIFGYLDLKIKLYFTPGRLSDYLSIEYSDKIDSEKFNGVEPDNIVEALRQVYKFEFNTSLDTFMISLNKEPSFKPFGKLFHSFIVQQEGTVLPKMFEMYTISQINNEIKSYLDRVQPFLMWYIDCASFVDTDDDRWSYFFMFEKYFNENQKVCYSLAGYATIYKYYTTPFALPPKWRPRISQCLILPLYQRQGLGPKLYDGIIKRFVKDDDVVNITVEDPSEEFQAIRDFVDVSHCSKLSNWTKENLLTGYTPKMEEEIFKKFKICKKQARRVYEILRLSVTNMHDVEQYKSYRLNVKNRLNAPHQKDVNFQKKLLKVLKPDEMKTFSCLDTEQQRKDKLHSEYKELEGKYLKVIERFRSRPYEE